MSQRAKLFLKANVLTRVGISTRWSPSPGPPPELEIPTLQIVAGQQSSGTMTLHHEHLSGWKKSGAYRVYLSERGRGTRTFIFKRSFYDSSEIPALMGLPVTPGPPEYAVYECANTNGTTRLIPEVFYLREIEPRRHYEYLLEDLALTLQRGLNSASSPGRLLVRLAADLPRVHREIKDSMSGGDHSTLIVYDDAFRLGMADYISVALRRYRDAGFRLPVIFMRDAPRILDQYSTASIWNAEDRCLVHGDYHLANIFVRGGCIKLVDWEWAGYGLAHMDLASLLKHATGEVEQAALSAYAAADPGLEAVEHWTRYEWCKLERGLIDAAFLALQSLDAENRARFDLHGTIYDAALRAEFAYRSLRR